MAAREDPYVVLGVRANATDQEVRSAYRRLVQLHHPDHNNGSPESERRFEQVQEAYARIRELRAHGAQTRPGAAQTPPPSPSDPDLEARLADMERELSEAHQARERARRAAAEAAAAATAQRKRPSDEELGYVKTDDSFSKIFADAGAVLAEQLADLLDDARDEIKRRRS